MFGEELGVDPPSSLYISPAVIFQPAIAPEFALICPFKKTLLEYNPYELDWVPSRPASVSVIPSSFPNLTSVVAVECQSA